MERPHPGRIAPSRPSGPRTRHNPLPFPGTRCPVTWAPSRSWSNSDVPTPPSLEPPGLTPAPRLVDAALRRRSLAGRRPSSSIGYRLRAGPVRSRFQARDRRGGASERCGLGLPALPVIRADHWLAAGVGCLSRLRAGVWLTYRAGTAQVDFPPSSARTGRGIRL